MTENSDIEKLSAVELVLQTGCLVRDEYGLLVVPASGRTITPEMVKEESEDELD